MLGKSCVNKYLKIKNTIFLRSSLFLIFSTFQGEEKAPFPPTHTLAELRINTHPGEGKPRERERETAKTAQIVKLAKCRFAHSQLASTCCVRENSTRQLREKRTPQLRRFWMIVGDVRRYDWPAVCGSRATGRSKLKKVIFIICTYLKYFTRWRYHFPYSLFKNKQFSLHVDLTILIWLEEKLKFGAKFWNFCLSKIFLKIINC